MIIGIVLIIGVLLYFNSKKKYNTDLETINPPMTKKERDSAIEQISDKEYIEYLRSIPKSKD